MVIYINHNAPPDVQEGLGEDAFCSDGALQEYLEGDGQRLIRFVWKKLNWAQSFCEFDDYYQAACLEVARCLVNFHPGRGAKLSTYIITCLEHMLDREYSRQRAAKRWAGQDVFSLEQVAQVEDRYVPEDICGSTDEGHLRGLPRWGDNVYGACLANAEERWNEVEESVCYEVCVDDLDKMLDGGVVSQRQADILRLLMAGFSYQEVGCLFSVTSARVSQLEHKAVAKLRRHLAQRRAAV